MRNKIVALVASVVMFATPSLADDWDVHQNNHQLSKDNYHIRIRDYSGKDTQHVQVGYKTGKWKFQYQYWENKGKIEHRPRFDYRWIKARNFSFGNRVEFRDVEGKDRYIRLWAQFNYKQGNFKLSVNPRFAFDKDGVDEGTLENILTIAEYKFKVNKNLSIVPAVWYQVEGEKDFGKKKSLYSALNLKYKF